ncbi:ABC transporter permease [Eubacterium ramulus]|uniref:ABC transporter permease n=1 Tax=Eubacterium ramulus TaxID=39490 RepID=UPI0022E42583|nr:ABC transporter permease [Eubacterium ramulus]
MKSKTSCFNKTIFLKNMTRFWPVWAVYLAYLFFNMTVRMFLNTRNYMNTPAVDHYSATPATNRLMTMLECISGNLEPYVIFFAALVAALTIFSYLFTTRSCYMMHALPVKRSELFVTNYISGFLFLLLPQLVTFLLNLLVCIINNITSVEYLLYWLLYMIGMSFLFYTLAVFCCMLTGHAVAAAAYYFVGNFLYIGIKSIATLIISSMCYGMGILGDQVSYRLTETRDTVLSPFMYLLDHVSLTWSMNEDFTALEQIHMRGSLLIGLYCIIAVVFLILAYVFYQKRQLECTSDVVAFGWLHPCFRWMLALVGGFGLSFLLFSLLFDNTAHMTTALFVFLIPCSFVSFFISEMLLKKRFHIFSRKRWIEWAACIALCLIGTGLLKSDAFRIERRIPDTDQIAAIYMYGDYEHVYTDEADFEVLEKIHQNILNHRQEYLPYSYQQNYLEYNHPEERSADFATATLSDTTASSTSTSVVYSESDYISSIQITYYLKNGRKIMRRYEIPVTNATLKDDTTPAYQISKLETGNEDLLRYLLCYNYEDVTFVNGTLSHVDEYGHDGNITLNQQQTETLYEALKADILAGNYPAGLGIHDTDDNPIYYDSFYFYGQVPGDVEYLTDMLPSRNSSSTSSDYKTASANTVNAAVQNNKPTNYYSSIEVSFSLSKSCTNTIQAMIDLGLIDSASDLMTQNEYYDVMNVDEITD